MRCIHCWPLVALLPWLWSGCISNCQFVSGRTLDPGRSTFSLAEQSDLVERPDPQLAYRRGLPGRVELGLVMLPNKLNLETHLRWELTPPSLPIDAAVGSALGVGWNGWRYLRTDLTVSHQFHGIEPYLNVAQFIADDARILGRHASLGAGLALPLGRRVRLVGEYRREGFVTRCDWANVGFTRRDILGLGLVFGRWR